VIDKAGDGESAEEGIALLHIPENDLPFDLQPLPERLIFEHELTWISLLSLLEAREHSHAFTNILYKVL